MNKFDKCFKLSIDIIVCFLILLQSIKKGGFYTIDIKFFLSSIIYLGMVYLIYIVITYFINKSKDGFEFKIFKLSKTYILLGILAISYTLPVIFGKAIEVTDAKFEFLRYLSIFILYIIVRNSCYKKVYYYTVIALGVIQVFIGIDGLASRYLLPFLEYFKSGYLRMNITRLSGTIQYANTAAILIAISSILLFNNINKYIVKIRDNNSKSNNIIMSINFMLFTICTLAIILTGSRLVLTIYIISLLIYIYKNKSNKLNLVITIIASLIISFLGSNNILNLVLTDPNKVYVVFLTYMVLSIIAIRYIIKYVINSNLEQRISRFKVNKYKLSIIVISFTVIYILIGFNIHKPLTQEKNEKNNVISRSIYGVTKGGLNSVEITVKENEPESEYIIALYEENRNYVNEEVFNFSHNEIEDNTIKFDFNAKDDILRLNVVMVSKLGSVSITELKLNNDVKPLEYAILPSDMVFRLIEFFKGSSSSRDRVHFMKDSYLIWRTSPIIGRGGEAFRYLYKSVQTIEYKSTEAHNSFLQIFVEAGLVGGITVVLLIFYVIKNNKSSIIRFAFIMYVIHCFTDLNFTFFISMLVFSMLIGIMENKYDKEEI